MHDNIITSVGPSEVVLSVKVIWSLYTLSLLRRKINNQYTIVITKGFKRLDILNIQ